MSAISIKYKSDSYLGAVAITPSNTADLAVPVSALYVGVGGNIKVITASGETVTFVGVVTGTVLPVAVTRVYDTLTTATTMIGLK